MKVIFFVGPTASGKSANALYLAQKFGAAIVNCDSVQAYRELDIGSAKPSLEERAKVPHYLFDYIPVGGNLTAGQYQRDFENLMQEIETQYPAVLVVGGTGFYFQAIENGMFQVGSAQPEMIKTLEEEIKSKGAETLHAELTSCDPESAKTISSNDHYRLVRALEIFRSTGKTLSQVRLEFEANKKVFPYPLLKLGIWAERMDLEPRIRARTTKMLASGWLDEVDRLLQAGHQNWSALQSVGYREVTDFLLGTSEAKTPAELSDLIVTSTLQLAKKQRTWFKRDLKIQWAPALHPEDCFENTVSEFLS